LGDSGIGIAENQQLILKNSHKPMLKINIRNCLGLTISKKKITAILGGELNSKN
jgi:hypothetical protein